MAGELQSKSNLPKLHRQNVCHINVNGLVSKTTSLDIILKHMNVQILCITEHKLYLPKNATNLLEDYICGAIYCRKTSNGGGAAIYVRKGTKYKELHLSKHVEEGVFEAAAIIVEDYCVLSVYRPPNGCMENFYNLLQNCICKAKGKRNHVFICGDLNIDVMSTDKNKEKCKRDFENFLSQNGLLTITNTYTRQMEYCKSAIDHIVTNVPLNVIDKDCNVEVGISDHSLQYVTFKETGKNSKKHEPMIYRRLYTAKREAEFIKALEEENWNCIKEGRTVNDKFNKFHQRYLEMYDKSFPLRQCKKSQQKSKRWITPGIKRTSKNFRHLCKEIKSNGDPEFSKYFRRYRSIYRKMLNDAKRLSIEDDIKNAKNTSKAVWSLINNNMGKTETECENISLKTGENNTLCTDPVCVADMFNKFYSNIAGNLQGENKNKGTFTKDTIKNSMFLGPVTKNDVILAIANLKNKKSSGYDDICDEVLKRCHSPIIEPLVYLINASFTEGIFPDLLKLTKILPLYKKGDEHDPTNYRPVANITSFAKLFEFIIDQKIRDYLVKNNILSSSQYGFIKGKATANAIVDFSHEIYNAFDKRLLVKGIFYDMSKAFDLVDHEILLNKLDTYGIRGTTLNLIKSYLSNRKQLVEICHSNGREIKGFRSNQTNVNCGVPQGSILGPLLFILFINDLKYYVSSGLVLNFADDVSILIQAENMYELERLLNLAIQEMKNWCYANKLILNENKTNIIQFRTNEKGELNKNSAHQKQFVTDAKFLGIMIDQYLRWDKHTEYITKKLNSAIFGIKSTRRLSNEKAATLAYHGMFHSLITYGVMLWGNSTQASEIFKLQKKAIRSIYMLPQDSTCKMLFRKSNIMTLPSVYIYELLKHVKQNECKFKVNSDFHDYNTRQKSEKHVATRKLKVSQRDTLYIGAIMFNKLPENVRNLPQKTFKSTVKKALTHCEFYNVEDYLRFGINVPW